MKFLLSLVTLTALSILISGCGNNNQGAGDTRVRVVATTGMVGDAVRMIAGDKVDLTVMMGAGVDPHLYKATKGDIDHLNDADVIFYNGLHLEAKLTDVFKKMASVKTVVAVGDLIDSTQLRFPAGAEGHPDPHIWFDLILWRQAVSRVSEVLAAEDPVHADLYRANGKAYDDSLAALGDWVTAQIATIPEEHRVLVTAHDAFEYFGRRYGLDVRGLQGISTVTEAGLHDITSMVDFLSEHGIKAVFVESSVPRNTLEAVVGGCQEKGHDVTIGGQLYSDAMGRAGTPDGTFLGMVRHNVNTIVQALR
ncbi:zinc ABC transporter substrate-binding protein [bacterium]|nr:zinc ABC transporter substrate-binding protein [bacterium]